MNSLPINTPIVEVVKQNGSFNWYATEYNLDGTIKYDHSGTIKESSDERGPTDIDWDMSPEEWLDHEKIEDLVTDKFYNS